MRLLLAPAFLLLALATPAQAMMESPLSGPGASSASDPCIDPAEDPEHMVEFADRCTSAALESVQDSCVGALSAVQCAFTVRVEQTEDGTTIVTIAADQVEVVMTSVVENGTLVVTIAVLYADFGRTYVIDCTDRDHLPKVGGDANEWYGPCSPQEWKAWLN